MVRHRYGGSEVCVVPHDWGHFQKIEGVATKLILNQQSYCTQFMGQIFCDGPREETHSISFFNFRCYVDAGIVKLYIRL